MRLVVFIIGLFFSLNTLQADSSEIYKWTDSNGNVHYSDKPAPGAEQVNIPTGEVFSSPSKEPEENPPEEKNTPAETGYEKISIIEPADQTTIRNPQGTVSVALNLQPQLRKEDAVQVLVDGEPISPPKPATVFFLQNLTRGSHTITAQVVNSEGNILKTSDSITIFMMQPRVGMVPH